MDRLCMFTPYLSDETRFVTREAAAKALRSYRRNAFVERDPDMRGSYWLVSLFGERHHLDTFSID
jgi:hypothetical protein